MCLSLALLKTAKHARIVVTGCYTCSALTLSVHTIHIIQFILGQTENSFIYGTYGTYFLLNTHYF